VISLLEKKGKNNLRRALSMYICPSPTLQRNKLLSNEDFSLRCVSNVAEGIQYPQIDAENVEEVSLD
jgi:hypothetical protein